MVTKPCLETAAALGQIADPAQRNERIGILRDSEIRMQKNTLGSVVVYEGVVLIA
jgi:hypothetical protein